MRHMPSLKDTALFFVWILAVITFLVVLESRSEEKAAEQEVTGCPQNNLDNPHYVHIVNWNEVHNNENYK